MPVDTSIFNLANQPAQFGPDLKQIITLQNLAQQMQARKMVMDQEQQGQNALRQVFSNPESINAQGLPTPNALAQIGRDAPAKYMELLPQVGQAQHQQALAQFQQSKTAQSWMDSRYKHASAAVATFDEVARTQGEAAARKAAQQVWAEGLETDANSGIYPPNLVQSVPKEFPQDVAGLRAKLAGYQASQVKPETIAQQQHNIIEQGRLDLDRQKFKQGQFRGALEKPEDVEVPQPDGSKKVVAGAWDRDNRVFVSTDGTSTPLPGAVPVGKTAAGAAAGTPLDDATVNYWAKRVNLGDPLPSAYRDADSRKRIMTAVAKLHPESEGDAAAGESIARKAELRANTQALGQITKVAAAAEAYENTTLKNMDMVMERLPKGIGPLSMPWLDRWIETGRAEFGSADVPPYTTALVTVANEYAKVMSGATGAQGSTVDARKEAASLLNRAQTRDQVVNVLDVMKQDMENKKAAYREEMATIRGRIAGAGSSPTESTAPAVPSAAPATTGAATDSGMRIKQIQP